MRYDVKAVRGAAAVVVLPVDAPDPQGATMAAHAQGYTVLSVRAATRLQRFAPVRKARFPLLLFAQELHSLLDAGLSLVEALEPLAEKDRGGATGRVLGAVIERLREGLSFSQALAADSQAFPEFFVATVRASERSGALSEALGRFAAYQAQLDAVRKKVVSASIYPALLLGTGGLVMVFLLAYVVPRFAGVFADAGLELPWSTRVLVAWGELVQGHGLALIAGAIAALAAGAWAFAQRPVRVRLLAQVWRMGALGERVRVFQLARFYRTLGMLVQGGLPIVQALDLAANVLPELLRERLTAARRAIAEGQCTSDALERHGLATPVAVRMLRVGERGGSMGEMLVRIAVFLDEETARWIDWFTRLFEPILMALIGLLVGTIIVLMYVPVFELAGAVK
ncbi:MAG: type II secretion system F family protein [Candidatus Parcubacteria bacterium]|nr:type II secretion system F family protein [Burkholderiales bacterium]